MAVSYHLIVDDVNMLNMLNMQNTQDMLKPPVGRTKATVTESAPDFPRTLECIAAV